MKLALVTGFLSILLPLTTTGAALAPLTSASHIGVGPDITITFPERTGGFHYCDYAPANMNWEESPNPTFHYLTLTGTLMEPAIGEADYLSNNPSPIFNPWNDVDLRSCPLTWGLTIIVQSGPAWGGNGLWDGLDTASECTGTYHPQEAYAYTTFTNVPGPTGGSRSVALQVNGGTYCGALGGQPVYFFARFALVNPA